MASHFNKKRNKADTIGNRLLFFQTSSYNMKTDYDLIVIGGGSAGIRAARLYAASGKQVALVETGSIGGTCVNVGCIPKKLFAKAAHFAHNFSLAACYGWSTTDKPQFDWPTLVKNSQMTISNLHPIYLKNLEKNGVELLAGYGQFIDEHNLHVQLNDDTSTTIRAAKYIIATGGTPVVPRCVGAEHIITSNEFFTLPDLPRSIMVIGGGYIALELASLLQALGAQVQLLHRSDTFLRGFDSDIAQGVVNKMHEQGIEIRTNSELERIDKNANDTLLVTSTSDNQVRTDTVACVLAATGRAANVAGLQIEAAQVALNAKDGIAVNDFFQTSNERIYALGDVIVGSHTGHATLTPVAIAQAKHLIGHWLNQHNKPMDYSATPSAVFVQPTAASVGLSEQAAHTHYPQIKVVQTQFSPLPESIQPAHELRNKAWMKLVIDETTDRVLGAHMIGDGAEDMIQIAAVCIKQHLTHAQFNSTLPLHPSVAEELVLL